MADLVLNLTANASNFAAGMKSAQKAANSLFLDTRTNLEKFQMGLEKIQAMKAAGFINQDTAERAQHNLSKQLDPFGVIAQNQARAKADAERVASNQKTTASIIASERAAAQIMVRTQEQSALRVAAIKERLAERIGRANMQQTIAEAHLTGGSAGIGGNRAMIIQQLAFAAEDAATQFGTRGLAGAVMAAGNNLTFAASMMGPMIGVMSSVGLTAAMLAMTYFKVGNSAKKAAEETKTLKEETEKLGAIIKARREFVESIKEGGSEQNRDRLKSLKGELSDEEKLLIVSAGKTSRARLEILQAESRARKKNEETNAVTFMAGPGAIVIPVKANENAIKQDQAVVAARKKYIEVLAEETRLKAKIGVINSRSEDIEKRLLELRKANRESLQTGIWQARQDEIKKSEESAKNIRMQNPAFRFNEELKELDKLKEAKVLSEAEYQAERMRMEKDAVEQIRSQQKQNSQMKLTSAVDIRSAEAGSVIANAFAKAMSPQSDDPKALLMQQLKALNLIADRQKEIAAINNKQLGQQMKTGGNVELQMVN